MRTGQALQPARAALARRRRQVSLRCACARATVGPLDRSAGRPGARARRGRPEAGCGRAWLRPGLGRRGGRGPVPAAQRRTRARRAAALRQHRGNRDRCGPGARAPRGATSPRPIVPRAAAAADRHARAMGRLEVPAARDARLRRGAGRVRPPHRDRERLRARRTRPRSSSRSAPTTATRTAGTTSATTSSSTSTARSSKAARVESTPPWSAPRPRATTPSRPGSPTSARSARPASPTAGLDALARILSWKLAVHGGPPTGTVQVTSSGGSLNRYPAGAKVTLNRISGHRDGDATACPGDGLYAQLPQLRQMVTGGPLPVRASVTFTPRSPKHHLRNEGGAERPPRGPGGGPAARAPVEVQLLGRTGAWNTLHTAQNRLQRKRHDERAAHLQPRASRAFRGHSRPQLGPVQARLDRRTAEISARLQPSSAAVIRPGTRELGHGAGSSAGRAGSG